MSSDDGFEGEAAAAAEHDGSAEPVERSDELADGEERDLAPPEQGEAVPAPRGEPQSVAADDGFAVRVIEEETKTPIHGAVVHYHDTLSPNYRRFRRVRGLYEVDREKALLLAGDHVVTDERGVAVLPHGIPTQRIAVRHGALYGELEVSTRRPPPAKGYVIAISTDRTMRVRVLDEDGVPVPDARLVFHIRVRDQQNRTRWVMFRDELQRKKSKDGIQELPHVQTHVENMRRLSKSAPLVRIGLDVPGLTVCGPTIDIDEVPEEVIDVVFPKTGSVAVTVTDRDGEPVQRRVRLGAKPDFDYPDLRGQPEKLAAFRPTWELETDEQGRVRFPMVALGQELEVESVGKSVGAGERTSVTGPTTAGEELEVVLVKEFRAADLTGVAHGPGGPLADAVLNYAVEAEQAEEDTAYLRQGVVRTDAIGRFRLRLPPTEARRDGEQRVVQSPLYSALSLSYRAGADAVVPIEASVALPKTLARQKFSVGVVKLALPRLLASGRVFIDDERAKHFDRMLIEWKNPDNRNRWERVGDLDLYAFSGGRFEIRGEHRQRELRIRPRTWGYLPAPSVPFAPGAKDLEVRLYRAGYMRIAVLHDAEASNASFEVRLRPIHIDHPLSYALRWRFIGRADKRTSGNQMFRKVYWWSGLPRGTYKAEVRLLGVDRPIATLDQLQPQFGVSIYDVTPEVVNLRGQLRRVHVRAVDGKGRPVAGLVFPLGQDATVGVEGESMGAKGAVLHTTAGSLDVMVAARGYRIEKVHNVRGEQVVRMQPGIPVTVSLPRVKVPRGVGLSLRLRRRSYGDKRTYKIGMRHPLVARSKARYLSLLLNERNTRLRYRGRRQWKATLMEHGQFVVDVSLGVKGKKYVPVRRHGPVLVRDTSVEHEFTVSVAQRHVDRALAKLGLMPDGSSAKSKQRTGGKTP